MTNTTNSAVETTSIRESAPLGFPADRRVRVHQATAGDFALLWLYYRGDSGQMEARQISLTEPELARLADQIETVRAAIRDFTNPATRIVAGRSSRLNRG
jgi:hypothetical protein